MSNQEALLLLIRSSTDPAKALAIFREVSLPFLTRPVESPARAPVHPQG